MSDVLAARRVNRRHAIVLAVALVASFGYFYEGGGWNQNTRFDLVRAIVERHTLRIDAYHENTLDKAEKDGHYYTDKAPGASLTAVPAVAIVRAAMALAGRSLESPRAVTLYSYIATLASAGLPAAAAALCVFIIAMRLGASETAALVAALVCGLGTPIWAYATILYGHTLAAGCLMVAFAAALDIANAATVRRQIALGLLVGLAAGWAVVTEFPAAIPSAGLCLFALWRTGTADRTRAGRVLAAIAAGGAVAAAVLLAYNGLAFGALFHIGYTSETGSFEAMKTGVFGVSLPQPSVAWALLFGSYRGLLPLAPVLALPPIGFWFLLRTRETRAPAIVAGAIAVYYFLLTAGYAYWDGGWSYGSRHFGPAIPFLCIGLAPVWMHAGRAMRAAIVVLAVVGIGQSLVAVSTTSQPDAQYKSPMRELLWPAFKSGDFPIGWQSVTELRPPSGPMSQLERDHIPRASWNVGQLMGLNGHASLLPLATIWLGLAAAWIATAARPSQKR